MSFFGLLPFHSEKSERPALLVYLRNSGETPSTWKEFANQKGSAGSKRGVVEGIRNAAYVYDEGYETFRFLLFFFTLILNPFHFLSL